MPTEKNASEMESSKGIQGDGTAPGGIQSPGTFVPLSQEPHNAESSLPSKGESSKKE